jgi:hypothetical protein
MKATFSIHGFRIAKPRGLSFREFSRANNTSTKESKTVPEWQNRRGLSFTKTVPKCPKRRRGCGGNFFSHSKV